MKTKKNSKSTVPKDIEIAKDGFEPPTPRV